MSPTMKNRSMVRVIAGLSAVSAMAAAYPDTASRTASGGNRTGVDRVAPVVRGALGCDHGHMNLNSLRRAVSGLVAEDRPGFKRIDTSPARADDTSWLAQRRYNA